MSESSAIEIYARIRPIKANSKINGSFGAKKYELLPPLLISSDEEEKQLPRLAFRIPKDDNQGLINNSRENYEFKFDKIFDTDAGQEELFDVVAKDVVDSSIEGFNGTIFAYGQTGSGKTFTITGGAEKYADRGIIPRTLQYLFKRIRQMPDYHFDVEVSYLEIYNEVGYDLLDNSRDTKSLEDLPKVYIQEDQGDRMTLRNLSALPAKSEEDALNLLFIGDTNRVMAETPSNPSSSRSHCIFIISLTSRKNGEESIKRSKLHIVDLAGSERVSKTGVDGTLLKEAKHINLSLHYLEQVIIALREKALGKRQHIPYRNSMMTSVLRDSLGGNCKTKMVATIAVEDALVEESISTCRFAQRVALISNQISVNEEMDPYLVIEKLKKEIERLHAELALLRGGQNIDGPLPDYEKERVRQLVMEFIKDEKSSLTFGDYRKIQEAFSVLRSFCISKPAKEVVAPQKAEEGSDQVAKLNDLLKHRDNEIAILIEQLNALKGMEKTVRNSVASTSLSSIDSASTLYDTNVTFESFQQTHGSFDWIQKNKASLKQKYGQAKSLGETANQLRMDIKLLKEQIAENPSINGIEKEKLSVLMQDYRVKFDQLKQLKIEIEHTQHLLDIAKQRIVKDYEKYCQQSTQTVEPLKIEETSKKSNVSLQIEAFYKARDQLFNKSN